MKRGELDAAQAAELPQGREPAADERRLRDRAERERIERAEWDRRHGPEPNA